MKEANIRTVRGEATVYILSIAAPNDDADKPAKGTNKIFDTDGKFKEKIKVTTTVSKTGEIGTLVFDTATETDKDSCIKSKEEDNKGGYTVTVVINTKDALKGDAAEDSGE